MCVPIFIITVGLLNVQKYVEYIMFELVAHFCPTSEKKNFFLPSIFPGKYGNKSPHRLDIYRSYSVQFSSHALNVCLHPQPDNTLFLFHHSQWGFFSRKYRLLHPKICLFISSKTYIYGMKVPKSNCEVNIEKKIIDQSMLSGSTWSTETCATREIKKVSQSAMFSVLFHNQIKYFWEISIQ